MCQYFVREISQMRLLIVMQTAVPCTQRREVRLDDLALGKRHNLLEVDTFFRVKHHLRILTLFKIRPLFAKSHTSSI